jgi:hypothetical protein
LSKSLDEAKLFRRQISRSQSDSRHHPDGMKFTIPCTICILGDVRKRVDILRSAGVIEATKK